MHYVRLLSVASVFFIFSQEMPKNFKKVTKKSSKKGTKIGCMVSCGVRAGVYVH